MGCRVRVVPATLMSDSIGSGRAWLARGRRAQAVERAGRCRGFETLATVTVCVVTLFRSEVPTGVGLGDGRAVKRVRAELRLRPAGVVGVMRVGPGQCEVQRGEGDSARMPAKPIAWKSGLSPAGYIRFAYLSIWQCSFIVSMRSVRCQ